MATRKKGSKPTAAKVKAPPPPVDVVELDEEIHEALQNFTGYHKQCETVRKLEEQLAEARTLLERMAKPLRQIEAILKPEELKRLSESQLWDEPLKQMIGRVRPVIKKTNYNYQTNKTTKTETKTGAKPWKELQRDGASDAQILKNLKSVDAGYGNRLDAGDYCLLLGDKFELYRGSVYNGTRLIYGKQKLIAEIRRVMQIAEAAEKPAPAKKDPPAKSPKKKPAPKKPAKKAPAKRTSPAAGKPSANGKHHGNGKAETKAASSETDEEPKCCICGCTEFEPCIGGCSWVKHPTDPTKDLCSACLPIAQRQSAPAASPPELSEIGNLGPDFRDPAKKNTIATLNRMQRALLRAAVAPYPEGIAKAEANEKAGYKPGGKVSTAWKVLEAYQLIKETSRGVVRANMHYAIPDEQPAKLAEAPAL